jgi:hypothetical protein
MYGILAFNILVGILSYPCENLDFNDLTIFLMSVVET